MAMRFVVVLLLAGLLSSCGGGAATPPTSDHKRITLHTELAASYLKRKQYDVALQELHEALSIDSDDPQANYIMAVVQLRLGKKSEADRYFRRALEGKKVFPEAQHDYGVFLCGQGHRQEAIKWFDKALSDPLYRTPEFTEMEAAKCLLNQPTPDYARADSYLSSALKTDPRFSAALLLMARLRYETGNYLSARAFVQRALDVAGDTPEALLLAVKIETAAHSPQAAADYAARLRTQFPGSGELKDLEAFRQR
jgi:type IV pilus assembly protein PilF